MTNQTAAQRMVGEVLDGRFRIDAFIGAGGMGSVFQATQLNVNRRVAIKMFPLADVDDTQKARFEREARTMATFTHPNIVQFYDLGQTHDHQTYIVMEFVDGTTLSRMLRDGRLTVEVTLDIAAQLFSALAEAHAHGVVHRDIKPENMLVAMSANNELRLKVLDFGLAHNVDDARLTQEGRVSGTPYYIAPEMARGQAATPQTDLYSAGVVLYEMLTGQPPFKGASMQVMFKHVNNPPPSLQPWVNDGLLPVALVDIVTHLLEKESSSRPKSAASIVERIEALRGRPSMPTLPVRRDRPMGLSALPDSEPSVEAPSEVKGAWEAFHSVASSAPEPESVMDPNIDASHEFLDSFGASDVEMKSAPSIEFGAVDQLAEIRIPEGARVMSTDQLTAVKSPAPATAPAAAPPSVTASKPEDLRPIQPAAYTVQVHDGAHKPLPSKTPWIIWALLLVIVVAIGGALYSQFTTVEDTRTPEQREADWLRQKREAEARLAAQQESETYEVRVIDRDEPTPEKSKPKPKPKPSPTSDDVIEIFENQDEMKASDKIKIERRR